MFVATSSIAHSEVTNMVGKKSNIFIANLWKFPLGKLRQPMVCGNWLVIPQCIPDGMNAGGA